jgi:hypothetical protein
MATDRLPALEVTVTDGKEPVVGAAVKFEIDGDPIGEVTTSGTGAARIEAPPGLTRADADKLFVTVGTDRRNVAWGPYYTFAIRRPWWQRAGRFVTALAPSSVAGWLAVLSGGVVVVYLVACGVSWAAVGSDPLGYNARCARIAIENAASAVKPPLPVPAGHDAQAQPVALEADVPQFFSYRVRVSVAPESKRAVPAGTGAPPSADAAAFNDAWRKYEEALRKAAAQNTMPSAIECPREEIAAIMKFFGALSGKDEKK